MNVTLSLRSCRERERQTDRWRERARKENCDLDYMQWKNMQWKNTERRIDRWRDGGCRLKAFCTSSCCCPLGTCTSSPCVPRPLPFPFLFRPSWQHQRPLSCLSRPPPSPLPPRCAPWNASSCPYRWPGATKTTNEEVVVRECEQSAIARVRVRGGLVGRRDEAAKEGRGKKCWCAHRCLCLWRGRFRTRGALAVDVHASSRVLGRRAVVGHRGTPRPAEIRLGVATRAEADVIPRLDERRGAHEDENEGDHREGDHHHRRAWYRNGFLFSSLVVWTVRPSLRCDVCRAVRVCFCQRPLLGSADLAGP